MTAIRQRPPVTKQANRITWPKPFVALRELQRPDWTREILAGVTLAALMIPLNVGYAEVAGLSPVVGLYAAIVPMVGYAIFVTSRHVIASPDAAIAALMGSLLTALAVPGSQHYSDLAFALAILCGLFFALFWLFRLGFLANYLSKAVLVGLITGLGLEVLLSQIRKIMGVSIEADGFFREAWAMILAIPRANLYSIGVGLGSIAIIRLLKRYAPKLPGALIALIVMTALVALFGLEAHGVRVLGAVPGGLPRPTIPHISFADWMKLIPAALALVALTVSEGLLLARKYAQTYGYKLNPDQDLLAYGISNVLAGLTGAFAVGASSSRTAAMDDAGQRTQWPSIVAAGVVAIVLLFFTDLLALLPSAALAGIVANAVLKLIEVDELRELRRLRQSEFWIAIICTLSVLVLGTLPGLTIAFLLTTIEVVRRAGRPRTSVLARRSDGQGYGQQAVDEPGLTAPGGVVYRFGGPIFFANANVLRDEVEAIVETRGDALKWFVFDLEAVNDIDTTGAEALAQCVEMLARKNVRPAISRAYAPLPALLERYELTGVLDDHLYETNRQAVAALSGEK